MGCKGGAGGWGGGGCGEGSGKGALNMRKAMASVLILQISLKEACQSIIDNRV